MAVLRPLMVIFSASTWIFFTKLKFRRSGRVYILIGSKVMTQNTNISLSILFQFCKKTSYCVMFFCFSVFYIFAFFFCICAITFEPIKIWTCSTTQNDRLNFSFVEDIHVICEKMAIMVKKRTFRPVANFGNHPLCETQNFKWGIAIYGLWV